MKKADIQETINKLRGLQEEAYKECKYQEYLEDWKTGNYFYGKYKGFKKAIEILEKLLEK